MLENAVMIQSEKTADDQRSVSHILAAKVRVEDKKSGSSSRYIVGMVIHENADGSLYYDHEMTDIKADTGSSFAQGHNLGRSLPVSVMNIIQNALLSSGFDEKSVKNIAFSVVRPYGIVPEVQKLLDEQKPVVTPDWVKENRAVYEALYKYVFPSAWDRQIILCR